MTTASPDPTALISIDHVTKRYPKGRGESVLVLDDISLDLKDREIVSLLGRSGCGKSTLLRILAGLMPASTGSVRIGGRTVDGPAPEVAMVFQSFALFPWLTVLENVELGLEAQGVPAAERRRRAVAAIDLIGLDGYENAYPKEMSGGMRQRVGMARALVVNPKLLLMDEAFSALDVLTAETLRTDLLDLWAEGRMSISAILLVTHNIEEAVLMSDRIVVLSSNPGRVAAEMKVDLPQPRNRLDPPFRDLVEKIYAIMTKRPGDHAGPGPQAAVGIAMPLPPVSPNLLAGLLEAVDAEPHRGHADLPALAGSLQLEADELLPMCEALGLLRLAELADGDLRLTEDGTSFVHADTDHRKSIFAKALLAHVPLVAAIRRTLDERWNHRASAVRFSDELEDHMSPEYAEATLKTAIAWGRYAELYNYDEQAAQFSLEDIDTAA